MPTTVTYDEHGPIRKVLVDWESDGSGNASITTKKIIGTLIKGVTDPGTAAPTDNYDITIADEKGMDVLAVCQSKLTDRDTTNTEQVYFLVLDAAGVPLAQSLQPVVCDRLTITVANAGAAKTGQLALYYRAA